MSDVRELVSRQLHLPPQFVRVDECDSAANNEVSKLDKNSSSTANQDFALSKPSDAASSFNGSRRVIILTTFDWLTAVQSDARLSSTSGDGAIGDFDRISDADRTRFLAPSTQSVPAPWIRVGVVVELKKEVTLILFPAFVFWRRHHAGFGPNLTGRPVRFGVP